MADAVLKATERMSEFQPLIARAAEAGESGDATEARRIAADEKSIVASIERGTAAFAEVKSAEESDAKECQEQARR